MKLKHLIKLLNYDIKEHNIDPNSKVQICYKGEYLSMDEGTMLENGTIVLGASPIPELMTTDKLSALVAEADAADIALGETEEQLHKAALAVDIAEQTCYDAHERLTAARVKARAGRE